MNELLNASSFYLRTPFSFTQIDMVRIGGEASSICVTDDQLTSFFSLLSLLSKEILQTPLALILVVSCHARSLFHAHELISSRVQLFRRAFAQRQDLLLR